VTHDPSIDYDCMASEFVRRLDGVGAATVEDCGDPR
jgi:hypothetical protein